MLELWIPRATIRSLPVGQRGRHRESLELVSDSRTSARRCGEVLETLEGVIASRKRDPSVRSYTTKLLAGGPEAAGAKVVEEAAELVEAARGETDDRVVCEAADLLYHTLVLLACRNVPLARVEDELARRFGVSGLEEKAARQDGGQGATT
ncbi:MAG: phosphoribosyl-ATP diphosphatase [Planctomycetia bacterium]|nr:phosphoribosyl-ATP diphosphatase [Planctomycetia bacterium]